MKTPIALSLTFELPYEIVENELISQVTFEKLTLSGPLFSQTTFKHVTFKSCVFYAGRFENCDFVGCNFIDCTFQFNHLEHCKFKGSTFDNCIWQNSSIKTSSLQYCQLDVKTLFVLEQEATNQQKGRLGLKDEVRQLLSELGPIDWAA